ncbi:exonuclease domain-containing protein [Nonomuraea sp. NPDC004580]|uniref:exonuclease domain-containing protein n=1 Tax=Nonomuraea sp. NPDC004580 TaxID=3154552 RepID=UPI0033BA0428
MSWHLARLCALDTETTSPNPEDARIVEAYCGYVGGGEPPLDRPPLLINPGVEIPAEATAIHGYDTAYVREHGVPAKDGVQRVVAAVVEAWQAGIPVVGHNVRFDLTVIDREAIRHGFGSLLDLCGGSYGPVVDTFVISKHLDKWRRRVSAEQGAHVLKTCAAVFGIPWNDEDAHGARYDALIADRVAWRMGAIAAMPRDARPRIQSGRGDDRALFDALAVDLPTLFANQKRWAAEQAASYQEWLRSPKAGDKQDAKAVISGAWPVEPAPAKQPEGALT